MKRTAQRLAASLAILTLGITACAGTEGDNGGNDRGGTEAEATDTGGEVTVASSDPVPNLVPGRQTNAFGLTMTVFTSLTFLEEDGSLSYLQAESVESEDQIKWTITLRAGWTFHDGSPVTAQDYVDSWNAVAYGPNAFENSGQLANIEGFTDLNPDEGEPEVAEMSGLEVLDDLTFEVALTGPDSQFPIQLSQAQTATYPMPPAAFDDFDAYGAHPVGNGPFAITTGYTEGEPIVAERYEGYAGEVATLDQITWMPYTDNVTAYNDALAGNVDLASLPANRMNQAHGDFGENHVHAFPGPGISYLGIPDWDDRYEDVRVRQAISMAIDRETISDVIYGGFYEPATAWAPSVMPGTPEGVCGEYCEYDPEAAAELLNEAGGFDGEITINYPGNGGLDDLYNAIANDLRQNLGVESVAVPTADWADFVEGRSEAAFDGAFFSRWGALYPSQQATLRAVFVEGGGCNNCAVPYSSEVVEAIADADANDDGSGDAYAAVQEIIAEEFPVPPLFFETYNMVTSERIAELPTSAIGEPRLTHIILAED